MPALPEGTDRNRLVVVVPKDLPEGAEPVEHVVGAAWLQSPQGAEDFEFIRFEGETQEQADAREAAAAEDAAEAAKPAEPPKTEAPARRSPSFE